MSEQIEQQLLSRFRVVKKMGSGAYGHVFKVEDRRDNKIKALKKNFDAFSNSTDAQRIYREIMFLLQLRHPNIISLEEVIKARNPKDVYLLFQYMDADLHEVSRAQNILTDNHRKFILYQVAKAIFYLHSSGLIHRDLKPSNILINQECDAKICDFGLVRSVDECCNETEGDMTEYIATRWYRAPEIILGSRAYSKAIDIWSYGCIVAEVFMGKPMFPGTSTLDQLERVLKWTGVPSLADLQTLKTGFHQPLIKVFSTIKTINKSELMKNCDPDLFDLLKRTLQFNCQKRITVEEILQHPFFSDYYNEMQIASNMKKIKVPIKDSTKLTVKQYRSLIHEQISKSNTRSEDFTITRVRTRSLKTQDNSITYKPMRGLSDKKVPRSHSQQTEKTAAEEIKTIKKTDLVRRKNYIEDASKPVSKGPSAEKKLKQRQEVHKNPYYQTMKGTAVRFRRWAAQTQANPKLFASSKNVNR